MGAGASAVSGPFLEKTDVFLPGRFEPGGGETLTQTPAYHWEAAEHGVGLVYYSTREPDTMLIHFAGLSWEERQRLPRTKVEIDRTGTRYHDYDGFGLHLPGLIVTSRGTAIATCQKRHNSMGDFGNRIDLAISRSRDAGRTWSAPDVLFAEEGTSAVLGSIFEDRAAGTVFVSFWKMPVGVANDLGYFGDYAAQGGGFWLIASTDDGATWSEPARVVPEPNGGGWVGWPNNCVHGIQLAGGPRAGRLVIPAFLYKEGEPGQVPGVRGGLLYSDDGAASWQAGAVLPEGSDEVSVVETAAQGEGGLYVTHRMNTLRTGKRHFARSANGGRTFCQTGQHEDLDERDLHAGLVRCTGPAGEEVLIFSHPGAAGAAREMTVCLSRDGGRTWPVSRVLDPGPSRYSDLAVTADGTILCLYTNGTKRDRDKISAACFNLAWLEGG